jgi:hypothetical protein
LSWISRIPLLPNETVIRPAETDFIGKRPDFGAPAVFTEGAANRSKNADPRPDYCRAALRNSRAGVPPDLEVEAILREL